MKANKLKLLKILQRMRQVQPQLAALPGARRNQLLRLLAHTLLTNQDAILRANRKDLDALLHNSPMRDRLTLDEGRIRDLADSLRAVAALPDPLGAVLEERRRPNGLLIKKIAVPLGVIAIIFEARPNVTVDLAALAIKSGNAVVLKGGKESYKTNRVLVNVIHKTFARTGLSKYFVYLIGPKDDWRSVLLTARELIDALIPRGGQSLINFVRRHARIPVIETGAGVCHTFVDEKCDLRKAIKIIINAKTQRPSVCNSLDTLVIHSKAAKTLLPGLAPSLAKFGVEIFADRPSFAILRRSYPLRLLRHAKPADFGREFLSLRMSVKTVKSFRAGLEFVKTKTSHHSEAIISRDRKHIRTFLKEADAAVVYENVSTRFTDGGEFGMGAEVGISTQKLHARGPMGAEALTSYKWLVSGKADVRK